jgi:aminobenzoyl-glutamate transport protein
METSKKKRLMGNIITSFLGLTLLVMVVSLIGNVFGWQSTFTKINPVTGNLEKTIVTVSNLFSGDEIRYILGNAMANFVTFAPLGTFLLSLIGIGVAYKSGLLTIAFTMLGRHLNKFWMTFIFIILGILSNFAGEVGYVILIPLAAIFYLVNNRNPIVAILSTFVAVASGQSINFLLSNLEYGLVPYTGLAAKLTDPDFAVGPYSNIFFSVVGVLALAFLITYVTEKIIIPRIPKYKRDEEIIEEVVVGRREKRGLILANVGTLILVLIYIYMLIPGLPLSGLLLDNSGKTYIVKLFGSDSYFSSSIVYILALILLISGWLYGLGSKTIKGREHFSNIIYDSLNNVGGVLILIFLASQFVAIFKRSNLGLLISSLFVDWIKTLNFTSIPLILLVFVLVCIANIFFTSTLTKWTFASPVIVPTFMNSNMTAEFAQAVFRVSESATNILTPLLAYFIIFVGYLEIYNKDETRVSLRDCYKLLWSYSVAIALLWIFILVAWYIIGLPIGFGIYPTV